MNHLASRLTLFVLLAVACAVQAENGKFPDDFKIGAASSAMQVEGAWDIDGRGPSVWDTFTHKHPEKIADGRNTNDTADSYYFYEDDIKAAKSMGLNHYRFSISWSRILPDGSLAHPNPAGIAYYNKLINALLENGIEPVVTMFHFDLPMTLSNLGGFTNEVVVDYFEAYADLLYSLYGDRVKMWITINEPLMFCTSFHGATRYFAPTVEPMGGVSEYLCGHNVLKAHAVAYRLYEKEYFSRFRGKVGISLNTHYFYSRTDDERTVERAIDFQLGWFANPIFSRNGDYPTVMHEQIDENSIREGLKQSRLPTFSEYWIKQIQGSADFLGLNYYSSRYVELLRTPTGPNPSYERDTMLSHTVDPEWKQEKPWFIYSVPKGLGDLLRYIKRRYDNPTVIITENGCGDDGELNDGNRIDYLRTHLQEVLKAVLDDGCNVVGYTAWSLIDNFELRDGLSVKFGLFNVNFTSPRKERTPKTSSFFMKEIISTRRLTLN